MIETLDLEYAKKLKALRLSRGYKQVAMAETLGFKDQQECSDYETGKRHFTDKLILKICKVFGITKREFNDFQSFASNSKPSQSFTTKPKEEELKDAMGLEVNGIFFLNYKKLLLERDIRIIDLELALAQHKRKRHKTNSNTSTVYVII